MVVRCISELPENSAAALTRPLTVTLATAPPELNRATLLGFLSGYAASDGRWRVRLRKSTPRIIARMAIQANSTNSPSFVVPLRDAPVIREQWSDLHMSLKVRALKAVLEAELIADMGEKMPF